jgi:energy-converting hydrogenase B subunit Q
MSKVKPLEGTYAFQVQAADEPGSLYKLTEVIYRYGANIRYVNIVYSDEKEALTYFEISKIPNFEALLKELEELEIVSSVEQVPSFDAIYGKRVIVLGGGAQVAQVAHGAVEEADRHNIRGERISVDTLAIVGEEELAAAVRAVARLPRARVLVLAGALMGGEIAEAVKEVKQKGIIVVCTNMVGSVPSVSDLVVTDPLEAGVMAVMLIADTAKFSIDKVRGKKI